MEVKGFMQVGLLRWGVGLCPQRLRLLYVPTRLLQLLGGGLVAPGAAGGGNSYFDECQPVIPLGYRRRARRASRTKTISNANPVSAMGAMASPFSRNSLCGPMPMSESVQNTMPST